MQVRIAENTQVRQERIWERDSMSQKARASELERERTRDAEKERHHLPSQTTFNSVGSQCRRVCTADGRSFCATRVRRADDPVSSFSGITEGSLLVYFFALHPTHVFFAGVLSLSAP